MNMSVASTYLEEIGACYKAIADNTSDFVIIISDQFSIMYFNQSVANQFSIDHKKAIGKNIFEIFCLAGYKMPVESDYFRDGNRIVVKINDIEWDVSIVLSSRKKQAAILIGRKILSDRDKNIVKSLTQILDCTPGSVYWKDSKGFYLGCNMFMVKTAGLRSPDDIIGKTDFDLWPVNAKKIRENDLKIMESGKAISLEEKVEIQSGKIIHFASSKVPLKDEHGDIIGVICNSLDITKLKEIEIELKDAKEKAELSNKSKSTFIQNMEHDIRTPFSGVWGFANILAEQETDSEKKEFLSNIAICAKELLDYCDSILDFSRIEQGLTPVLEKTFSVKELIDSVMKIESIAAKHKKLTFSVHQNNDLPKIVIGDPYRLKCILLNLVSNAIKFTKEGSINLSVVMVNSNPKNRMCVIKFIVQDTGIGIPEDKRNIIYEKFTRGAPSNQGIYKGPGLGLRIVKQFVTELDGDIHLDSKIDKGTTFTLLLPFKFPLTEDIVDGN